MVSSVDGLWQLDGDLTGDGSTGDGTGAGALRYRDGHTGGVQAALVEEGTTNHNINPSIEIDTTGWNFHSQNLGMSRATDKASDGVASIKFGPNSVGQDSVFGAAFPNPATAIEVAQGQTWTVSLDYATDYENAANTRLAFNERTAGGVQIEIADGPALPEGPTLQRAAFTRTLAQATVGRLSCYLRSTVPSSGTYTFWIDRAQIEQKDHATTPCPEYTDSTAATLRDGYAWLDTAHNSASTRAAAKIELPLASAPDWVAYRYREAETGAMSVGYATTLTGNNVGTYGKISHDGSNLVIESDRLLVIGPLLAGTGTLTAEDKSTLESTTTWTLDLIAPTAPTLGQFLVIDVTGTDAGAPVVTLGGGD